jgi:predicted metal-binding membrane protein
MSIVWMAVIAALIAIEKTVPWRSFAIYGIAFVLIALGVLVLVAPSIVPGLTIPDAHTMVM